MQMVHIRNRINMVQMMLDFLGVHILRRFLQEYIQRFSHATHRVHQDKQCHTDGHQRIDQHEIGKTDHNSTDQHHGPAQQLKNRKTNVPQKCNENIALRLHSPSLPLTENLFYRIMYLLQYILYDYFMQHPCKMQPSISN